jgi:hypothetical protein
MRKELKCTSSYGPTIHLERIKRGIWAPIIQLSHFDQVKATSFLSEKECIVPN